MPESKPDINSQKTWRQAWENAKRAGRQMIRQLWFELAVAVLVLVSVLLTFVELILETSFGGRATTAWNTVRLANEIITGIFILELSLRLLVATNKRQFFREFWLDILAVLPLFRIFRAGRALRLLRLVRVLRLLGVMTRLASHYPSIFRKGLMEYASICGLLILTVAFGTLAMMYFENRIDQGTNQPTIAKVNDGSSSDSEDPSTNQLTGSAGDETGEPMVDSATGEQPGDSATRDTIGAGEFREEQGSGENQSDSAEEFSLENSFWFSLYSLFAGEPVPQTPQSRGGKIVAVFVMFMGLTIFAMFTGTVSAYMVDRFRTEGRIVEVDDISDHIVICGWNSKAEIIIQEYRATKRTRTIPIVVIAEIDFSTAGITDWMRSQAVFINDDFTRVAALERAAIARAKTCIILADSTGGRSDQDSDARTILAALTVEKINPDVYTCAEIMNQSYGSHLEMGNVNDYVVSGDYSAYMLAQSAMNRGLMEVIGELLTYQRGNEFYRYPIAAKWEGMSFSDLMVELKERHNAILVAVHPEGGKMLVNPKQHLFAKGDEIVVIASNEVNLHS